MGFGRSVGRDDVYQIPYSHLQLEEVVGGGGCCCGSLMGELHGLGTERWRVGRIFEVVGSEG